MSSSIDYLFDEELLSSFEQQKSAFPFALLPGELRNNIYDFAFDGQVINYNGKEYNVALEITANGDVEIPSITRVSRQLYSEGQGYFKNALRQPNSVIYAAVRSYNLGPLRRRIDILAKEYAIPRKQLWARTIVKLEGELKFEDVWSSFSTLLSDNNAEESDYILPVAEVNPPTVDGYGKVSLWNGIFSLPLLVKQVRIFQHNNAMQFWYRRAARFLENAMGLETDMKYREVDHRVCESGAFATEDGVKEVFEAVFNCYQRVVELKKTTAQCGFGSRRAEMLRSHITDNVQAVEAFLDEVGKLIDDSLVNGLPAW